MTVHSASDVGQLLAEALKVLPEPVVLYDDDHVLFANEAAARLLGASTPADLEGACLDGFVVPELTDVSHERRGYVMQDGLEFTGLPVKVCTLDGQIMPLRVDVRPISLDGMTVAMVTLTR